MRCLTPSDMPNLVSVDLGTNVFTFKDADNTQLILKSRFFLLCEE